MSAQGSGEVGSSVGKPTQPTTFPNCPPWCTRPLEEHETDVWEREGRRVVSIEHEPSRFQLPSSTDTDHAFLVAATHTSDGEWLNFEISPPDLGNECWRDVNRLRELAVVAGEVAAWVEAQR